MSIFSLCGQKKPTSDPYWEFDQSNHFRPKLSVGEFYKLKSFDFGWFLLEPLSEHIQDKESELKKGKTLSYGQKALYYWWYVDAQVMNGGFTQFYFNGYGKYVPTIIKGLKHVGDDQMAELVKRSYELYQEESNKIKDARQEGLEGLSNLYNEIKDFDELDSEYYDLNAETMNIIENFIRKNPNEFCVDENGREFHVNLSGDLKTTYTNGNIQTIIPLENGEVNGTFSEFYENGNPKAKIEYVNGEQTGEREEYYENGMLRFSIEKEPVSNGFSHTHYYQNGNIKSTEVFVSKYERVGKWMTYYANGQLKSETEFVEEKFLIQNCWEEDGTQIMKDGTGLYIREYSPWKGLIKRTEEEYLNYKRHGKQFSYSNGRLSLYQEMFEGQEHGLTKSYDKHGNLEYEVVFENGIEKSKTYYKNK